MSAIKATKNRNTYDFKPPEGVKPFRRSQAKSGITKIMNQKYNRHLKKSLELAKELIILADEGESESLDNGCRVLYGILRDCAYTIKARAESETKKHLFTII